MKNYPIKATFIDEITYDIPSQNYSDNDWKNDLDNMLEVGIDTLVIMRGYFYDKCLFPSKAFNKTNNDDFFKLILKEAEKRNMKVYLGLYITNLTWNDGDYKFEFKQNKIYIKEVLERYSKYKSFIGWYIPHEAGHDIYNFKKTLYTLTKYLKEITPNKKVLISPFFRDKSIGFNPSFNPNETKAIWEDLFKESGKYIDVCAFQDGTSTIKNLGEYFKVMKEVCHKHKIELWANVETFERDVRQMFLPIDFRVLKEKISIEKEYCDNMITFEFSHFMSPLSIFESARRLNKLYKDYYSKNK